jgi:methionyl-tRNA formyltransferase
MANVLLIGMGVTTLSALNSLAAKFTVVGVVRNEGSSDELPDPVVCRARELQIPVFRDTSIAGVSSLVAQLKPDCVVVSSYNRILGPSLTTQCLFVNVHYSPLPRYRGRANVNWALINDEPWAAISIHAIVPELDAGNILFQQRVRIEAEDTVADLYRKLNELQQDHLAETVARYLDGCEGIPQDEREATYGCGRSPEDGEIDWAATTRQISCLIRALVTPFPGAYTYFQGKRLTIWRAEPVPNPLVYTGRVPGRVVKVARSDGSVEVLTGDGVLKVMEVGFPGEPKTAAANVVKSVRETFGLRTADLWERIRILEQQVAKLTAITKGNEPDAK